jgi:hypothetical protein
MVYTSQQDGRLAGGWSNRRTTFYATRWNLFHVGSRASALSILADDAIGNTTPLQGKVRRSRWLSGGPVVGVVASGE